LSLYFILSYHASRKQPNLGVYRCPAMCPHRRTHRPGVNPHICYLNEWGGTESGVTCDVGSGSVCVNLFVYNLDMFLQYWLSPKNTLISSTVFTEVTFFRIPRNTESSAEVTLLPQNFLLFNSAEFSFFSYTEFRRQNLSGKLIFFLLKTE
jgi:hypothetical protein